jgi:hypothetical protein
MKMKKIVSLAACLGLVAMAGCSGENPGQTTPAASTSPSTSAVDGSKYLLSSEPAEARDVITVRQEARDDEEIVIVGRIGGSKKPMVEGRAAFSIVDASLKSCTEVGSDGCLTPWDFC